MNSSSDKLDKFARTLLERRWLIVASTVVLVIVIEYEEHRTQPGGTVTNDFWRETILFGLLLPLIFGLMLSLLKQVYEAKDEVDRTISQQQRLSLQLSLSKTWNSVLSTIVKFPASVLPVVATSLRVANPKTNSFDLVEYWSLEEKVSPELAQNIHYEICNKCESVPSRSDHFLIPCTSLSDVASSYTYSSYCLPLLHHDETVALLHLHFKGQPTLTTRQVRVLNMSAQEMALAIETARLEQEAQEHLEAAETERRRIARDLHDTLGQNISYLRLKLDQLTGEDALRGIGMIRLELERMRDIADDAYLQVRNTLADLHSDTAVDLNNALRDYMRLAGGRSNFKAHFLSGGDPQVLESHMRNQVMYIFREILNNIEKHAQARNVFVNLDWSKAEFCMIVRDDGAGFDHQALPPEGHFGLSIMQERALDLRAKLVIKSQPGLGTQVELRVPLLDRSEIFPSVEPNCAQPETQEVVVKN